MKDLQGRRHRYTYQNQVPLNAQEDAPLVNYIHYELSNEKGKVTFRNSWVTDIAVDQGIVKLIYLHHTCSFCIGITKLCKNVLAARANSS